MNQNEKNEARLPGMIEKAATIKAYEVTDTDLRLINKHTLRPLTAEEVFVFKAILCDNEVDRTFERFSLRALQDLKKLFDGKTFIKNHRRDTDNQIGRIFGTELEQDTAKTIAGTAEPYTMLTAKIYMVRTGGNADLIREIEAGIRKEGSVGCAIKAAICSICGTDNVKTYCPHWPGRKYAKDAGEVICTFLLDGATDAYEFSMVAVPAQKAAGVSKAYTGTVALEPDNGENDSDNAEKSVTKLLALRARAAKAKIKNMGEE